MYCYCSGSFLTYVILRIYTWLLNPDVVFVYLPSDTDTQPSLHESSLQNLPRNPNEAVEESVREFQVTEIILGKFEQYDWLVLYDLFCTFSECSLI